MKLESMSEEQQEVHIVLVSNDPNRAYPALILALGSLTMGAKCKLYCTMSGLDVVKREGSSKMTDVIVEFYLFHICRLIVICNYWFLHI